MKRSLCRLLAVCCAAVGWIALPESVAQCFGGNVGTVKFQLSKSYVIYDFSDNESGFASLHRFLRDGIQAASFANDTNAVKIKVSGYSSPEGSYGLNERLASERADKMVRYLRSFLPDAEISADVVAEDWDGLVSVLRDADSPYAGAVEEIAESEASPEEKEYRLRRISSGFYAELCRSYFPLLRRVDVQFWMPEEPEAERREEAASPEVAEPKVLSDRDLAGRQRRALAERNQGMQGSALQWRTMEARYGTFRPLTRKAARQVFLFDCCRTPKFAVGVNLLPWIGFRPDFSYTTVTPNVFAEYYFLKRWSVKAAFAYSNWAYGSDDRFQGLSSYVVEPRFWFSRKGCFNGFFVGIYGQAGDFNDCTGKGSYTGKHFGCGLSAGFLLPVYRGLCVELNVRGGYRHSDVSKYKDNGECNGLCRKFTKNEFDLTGTSLGVLYRF